MHPLEPSDESMRSAMRRLASGVAIATFGSEAGPVGLTVSSFTSISLMPPIIMIALHRDSASAQSIEVGRPFAVHILSSADEALSVRFSEQTDWQEKTLGEEITFGRSGAPIIAGPTTIIEGIVDTCHEVGTHRVLYGAVDQLHMSEHPPGSPLLYFDQNYRTLDRRH